MDALYRGTVDPNASGALGHEIEDLDRDSLFGSFELFPEHTLVESYSKTASGVTRIEDLVEFYAKYLFARSRSKTHITKVRSQILKIAREIGWIDINEINAKDFSNWLDSGHFAERTQRNYKDSINVFCSWLIKIRNIDFHPFKIRK